VALLKKNEVEFHQGKSKEGPKREKIKNSLFNLTGKSVCIERKGRTRAFLEY